MADIIPVVTSVKAYTGANVSRANAGATITAGQAIYLDSADNKLKLTDANAAATATCVGVSLNGGAVDQPIVYIVSGGLNPGVAVTVGESYAVSENAGGICPIADVGAGEYVSVIGVATTTSRIEVGLNNTGVAHG